MSTVTGADVSSAAFYVSSPIRSVAYLGVSFAWRWPVPRVGRSRMTDEFQGRDWPAPSVLFGGVPAAAMV